MVPSTLGCTRLFLSTAPKTRLLFQSKRWMTHHNVLKRPQHYTLKPLMLGGVRQHGSHGHHQHHDADIVATLKSSSKRGTRITIIGLASNVGLTITKGVAGWVMNSASLLAEALHSFSDLLSDFVTLYTFKMSRKPADSLYPYGYGKFETVGSVTVSSLLLAGAIGIGWHSFDLLMATLQTPVVTESATAAVAATASSVTEGHHHHGHGGVLDPNAAWFALASVIIKEWLYRATIKVGVAERSEVLMANAWHHRSDAYSSAVALVAIVGSYAGLPVLDPLGGIVVSGMLVRSSVGLLKSSMKELMDQGITSEQLNAITSAVDQVKDQELDIVAFHSIRGRKLGPFHHIDLVLRMNPSITMQKAYEIENKVKASVRKNCDNIQDILIHLEDAKAVEQQQQQQQQHHHDHEHDHDHDHDHEHHHH